MWNMQRLLEENMSIIEMQTNGLANGVASLLDAC